MARKHPTPLPPAAQPGPHAAEGAAPELVRLVNRTAVFTFLAAFAVVLGLVLLPRAWTAGVPIPLRVAASLPLVAAAGLIAHVRRLRAELRLARAGGRQVQAEPPHPPPAGARGVSAFASDPRAPAPTPR